MATCPLHGAEGTPLARAIGLAVLARRPPLGVLGALPFGGIRRRPVVTLATAVGLCGRPSAWRPCTLRRPRFCAPRLARSLMTCPNHIAVQRVTKSRTRARLSQPSAGPFEDIHSQPALPLTPRHPVPSRRVVPVAQTVIAVVDAV